MLRTTNLSRPIIESLYSEALLLADEVRAAFAMGIGDQAAGTNDLLRLALSSEGLKATTRMMHVLAWLLNQRAYFSGELSERQVKLHGKLPADRTADPRALAALEPETCELIAETERMHQRISRLDEAWRSGFETPSPARAIHNRLQRRLSDLG